MLPLFPRPVVVALVSLLPAFPAYAQTVTGITPTVDGIVYDLSSTAVTASFGYVNTNATTTTIPVGVDNFFEQGNFNKGQPRNLEPGTHQNVFSVTWPLSTWPSVTWSLAGLQAVASPENPITVSVVQNGATFLHATGDLNPVGAFEIRAASTFQQTGGTFTGTTARVLSTGTLALSGGSFTTDTLSNLAGGTVLLSSGGALVIANPLANDGTLRLAGGALTTPGFTNAAGGTVIAESGASTSSVALQNAGTFNGTGGDLTLPALTNTGTTTWESGTLHATDSVTNTGTLHLTGGTLSTAALTNSGHLDWTGGTIELTTGDLTTNGNTFLGANPNLAPGQTLRLASGATTIAAGKFINISPNAALITQGGTNQGSLYVTGGALTSQSGTFTNAAGATLSATSATLTFTGDGIKNGDGIQNAGTLNLIDTAIHGDLNSPAGSTINVASGVTFHGLVSGAATFTGGGLATFAGGYSPGDSPELVTHAGSVTFAPTNVLLLELAGLARGTGYDALDINGTLTFGGTLQVSLLDSFTPLAGATFNLFDWTTAATGSFATLDLPTLGIGLAWDTSFLHSDGVLSVSASAIPEPETYAAFAGLAALALAAGRRRRAIVTTPARDC